MCIWNELNTYDVLWHDKLVITQKALEMVEDRFWTKDGQISDDNNDEESEEQTSEVGKDDSN